MTPYRDPDDQRRASAAWYQRNRAKVLERTKARHQRVRAEKREHMLAAKDQACADCGVQHPRHSMEFDHVRGEKVAPVSTMAGSNTWSLADLAAEILKCDVVCVMCHRTRHWPNAT